jgi:hypothetical protein
VGDRRVQKKTTHHERLAQAHDLGVALALGVEIAASLARAQRERGEGVLEDLVDTQSVKRESTQE